MAHCKDPFPLYKQAAISKILIDRSFRMKVIYNGRIYLKKECGVKFPENVERSLDDWQAKIGRVWIRSLTVLETDDPLLLEEIKHIKGMDKIVIENLSNAVAINSNQIKKAKTIIEKNGWPVVID